MIDFAISKIELTLCQVGRDIWFRILSIMISELFEFLDGAGLEFVALTAPKIISILTIDDPVNFGHLDESLKNSLKMLSQQEQMTVADLVDGTVHIHEFYARKKIIH